MLVPHRIETPRLTLRCWSPEDAPRLNAAIAASRAHLGEFMLWAKKEETVDEEIAKLRRFRAAFNQNTDFIMGVFEKSGAIVGGTGIHPRVGPGGLEIGYWIAADRTRRGYATELAAALTRVAFEVTKVRFLEIRTARSNAVSARIPKKLGFVHEATLPRRLELVSGAFDDADIFTMHADAYEGSPAHATPVAAFDAGGRQVLG